MAEIKLGFIGLGDMGGAIALRLAQSGRDLMVWNRSAAKADAVLEAGAVMAESPAALTRECDIVFVCVTDMDAVEAVAFGPDGIAEAGRAGKLLVDHSTIHPLTSRENATRLKAATGMGWVDAPVSGGSKGVREHTLIVMAGGEDADIETIRPICADYAQRLSHMGPHGAGQATKTCNQMIIGATVAGCAEALRFAANFGVDAPRIPDCLSGGWADSTVLQIHARMMAAAAYENVGDARIMLKDMDIACDMGRLTDSPMPVTALVTALYRLQIAQGHDDCGQIGLMRLYADGPL